MNILTYQKNDEESSFLSINSYCKYFNQIGNIYYDKLSNNLKQFWRVKKREDAVFFQNEYHIGEYLSGKMKQSSGEPAYLFIEEGMDLSKTGWRIIPVDD